MEPCCVCDRSVLASEARLSIRVSQAVYCGSCRITRWPEYTPDHQLPGGCSATVRPSGYNRLECTLVAPKGGVFVGAGPNDALALSRARMRAEVAGAL